MNQPHCASLDEDTKSRCPLSPAVEPGSLVHPSRGYDEGALPESGDRQEKIFRWKAKDRGVVLSAARQFRAVTE